MRLSARLAVTAALFTAAPAMGAPMAGLTWLSICTEHGAELVPVPKDSGSGQDASTACHAACTLPRRNAGKRP